MIALRREESVLLFAIHSSRSSIAQVLHCIQSRGVGLSGGALHYVVGVFIYSITSGASIVVLMMASQQGSPSGQLFAAEFGDEPLLDLWLLLHCFLNCIPVNAMVDQVGRNGVVFHPLLLGFESISRSQESSWWPLMCLHVVVIGSSLAFLRMAIRRL
jgi:hypothetical protein